jgi:hypothetical protein
MMLKQAKYQHPEGDIISRSSGFKSTALNEGTISGTSIGAHPQSILAMNNSMRVGGASAVNKRLIKDSSGVQKPVAWD